MDELPKVIGGPPWVTSELAWYIANVQARWIVAVKEFNDSMSEMVALGKKIRELEEEYRSLPDN